MQRLGKFQFLQAKDRATFHTQALSLTPTRTPARA